MSIIVSNIIVTMPSFYLFAKDNTSCMQLTRICLLLQVGHLHAGCSKEVTVTFSSNQPVTMNSQPVRCKVCQVEFQQPLEQVADWDDQQRTVQWLSASQQALGTQAQHPGKNKVHMLSVMLKEILKREFTIIVQKPCTHMLPFR